MKTHMNVFPCSNLTFNLITCYVCPYTYIYRHKHKYSKSRYCCGICLVRLRKTTKPSVMITSRRGRYSIPELYDYETDVLTSKPRLLVVSKPVGCILRNSKLSQVNPGCFCYFHFAIWWKNYLAASLPCYKSSVMQCLEELAEGTAGVISRKGA
jgi:hypothetical protein